MERGDNGSARSSRQQSASLLVSHSGSRNWRRTPLWFESGHELPPRLGRQIQEMGRLPTAIEAFAAASITGSSKDWGHARSMENGAKALVGSRLAPPTRRAARYSLPRSAFLSPQLSFADSPNRQTRARFFRPVPPTAGHP